MEEVTIDYAPRPQFVPFHNRSERFACIVAHRRAGKTVACVHDLQRGALRCDRERPRFAYLSPFLKQGTPYVVRFSNTDGAFYLSSFFANPYVIPIGGLLPYTGATAPNSAFVFPFGQAISRSAYATYFSLVGTTFGAGDGSTTFNVPDLRGRAIFGLDNMGGSAAGRVTTGGSSVDGTVIGANGGGQTVTIAQANIPNYNLTVNDPGHSHTVSGSTNATTTSGGGGFSAFSIIQTTSTSATGITVNSNGSGAALNKMPPTLILPMILRVI